MRIESKIKIESTADRIFKILKDGMNFPKWNPAVDHVSELQSVVEDKIYFLKTAVGDIRVVDTEVIEDEHITWRMRKSSMNSIGYSLVGKTNDKVLVTLWVEFDDPKNKALFKKSGELALVGLKRYAEFLADGGNPENYDKRRVLVSPIYNS